jgi:hypothetical protein
MKGARCGNGVRNVLKYLLAENDVALWSVVGNTKINVGILQISIARPRPTFVIPPCHFGRRHLRDVKQVEVVGEATINNCARILMGRPRGRDLQAESSSAGDEVRIDPLNETSASSQRSLTHDPKRIGRSPASLRPCTFPRASSETARGPRL